MNSTSPYIVYRRLEDRDYLFALEPHGRLVTSEALDNAYCHRPATFEQELAELLADELNRSTSGGWVARATPKDCPGCGRELWANDLDVTYPNNRELTSWRVGCNEHDFGCGLEVEGDTYEETVARWNALDPETTIAPRARCEAQSCS